MRKLAVLFLILAAVSYLLYLADSMLGIVVVSGFIDGIHPCGLAVLFLFISFLLSLKKSRNYILLVGGVYILGVFLVYFGIGLGIMKTFTFFESHFMAKVGSALLIIVGLVNILEGITGSSVLKIPSFSKPYYEKYLEKGTVLASFIAGALVGLCAFPCAGGIYVAIISLMSSKLGFFEGVGYLVLYNIMFVFPLIISLALASDKKILGRLAVSERKNRRRYKVFLGAIMILFAVLLLLGAVL